VLHFEQKACSDLLGHFETGVFYTELKQKQNLRGRLRVSTTTIIETFAEYDLPYDFKDQVLLFASLRLKINRSK